PCPPGVDPDADPTRIICQRPYRGEGSPELYRVASSYPAGDRPGEELTDLAPGRRPPTKSAILLTDEQIDEIAAMPIAVRQPIEFRAGNVEVTIPAGTVLLPSDTFLTAMLMASVGDRHFHSVFPSPPTETLNLSPYLVCHGLTDRLIHGPVSEIVGQRLVELSPSPLSLITGDYVYIETTETL